MKKIFVIAVIALTIFSITNLAYGFTLKEEARYDVKDFIQLMGDKILTPQSFNFAFMNGNLFALVRDNRTRNLEWYVINPYSNKIVHKGNCPFKVFYNYSISPDSNNALVYTKYPTALWHLETNTGKWKKIYENPGEGEAGFSITRETSLIYPEVFRAYSLMDVWDEEHFIVDYSITAIYPESGQLTRAASIGELRKDALGVLTQGARVPKGTKISLSKIRMAGNNALAFLLRTESDKKEDLNQNSIFTFKAPSDLCLSVKSQNGLIPLDYRPENNNLLFAESSEKGMMVYQLKDGKKTELFAGKALMGRIFDNGNIGIATIDGGNMNIYLGTPGEKFEKVVSFNKPYAVGFTNDGTKAVFIGITHVICARIYK
ncbi:MAG: hypothetical protein ACLFQV_00135 [Vulcanimicrobiota bacterium]